MIMGVELSKRLTDIATALPLKNGMKVLEIGCGPGALARELANIIGDGYVLAIDRSVKAIQQAKAGSQAEVTSGRLTYRLTSIEDFELEPGEKPFDLAVAIRVGALDGRHPSLESRALRRIAKALTNEGRLFVDGGNPLKEIPLEKYRQENGG